MGVVAVALATPEAVTHVSLISQTQKPLAHGQQAAGQQGRQRTKTNREMKTEAEEGQRSQLSSQLVDASAHLLFLPPFEVKRKIIESPKEIYSSYFFPWF